MTYMAYNIDSGNKSELFNAEHNPEPDVLKLDLAPGLLLLHRPGHPQEMEARGLVAPEEVGLRYSYSPTCALVVKVFERPPWWKRAWYRATFRWRRCVKPKYRAGQYVFWRYKCDFRDQLPQPVIMHFGDKVPAYYTLGQDLVLAAAEKSEGPMPFALSADPGDQKYMHDDRDQDEEAGLILDSTGNKPGRGGVTLQ